MADDVVIADAGVQVTTKEHHKGVPPKKQEADAGVHVTTKEHHKGVPPKKQGGEEDTHSIASSDISIKNKLRSARRKSKKSHGKPLKPIINVASTPSAVQPTVPTAIGVEENEVITTRRACTDFPALIIFLVYVGFVACTVLFALVKADFRRLSNGVDSYGNVCGYQNVPIDGSRYSGQDMRSKTFHVIRDCKGANCTSSLMSSCEGSCPAGYKKQSSFNRCVPSKTSDTQVSAQYINNFATDFSLCWHYILLLCFVTVGLSIWMLFLLRFAAACFLWTLLFAVAMISLALLVFLWVIVVTTKGPMDMTSFMGAVIVTVLTVVYLIFLIILRKKIRFVAILIKETSRAVFDMPLMLFLPVLTFSCQAIVMLFASGAIICITLTGYPEANKFGEVSFSLSTFFTISLVFLILGFYWINQFFISCQHLTVAGCITRWFFIRNKKDLKKPITTSLKMTMKYHLGTACIGSFLITIIKCIRLFGECAMRAEEDKKAPFCSIFFRCCHTCVESIVKFVSRSAFVVVVMDGTPFMKSAIKAFELLSEHLVSLQLVQTAGDFLLFACEAGLAIAVTFAGILLIRSIEGITNIVLVVIIIYVLAYLICHSFFGIFEMAVDTLLLNYCEDCEANNGRTSPYYMSKSLKSFATLANTTFPRKKRRY